MLTVCLASASQAAFSGRVFGARPMGMGNAFVGLANDASALFINPAGLAEMTNFTLGSTYAQPDQDDSLSQLDLVMPALGGVVGLGFRGQVISGLQVPTNETASFTAQETLLSYSRSVNDLLSLAADLRVFNKGYSKDFPGSSSVAGSGSGLDVSLQYRYQPNLTFGLACQDINSSLKYQNGLIEKYPLTYLVGLAYWPRETVALALDVSRDDRAFLAHAGLEWTPVEAFSFRLGGEQSTTGTVNYTNLTAGLGVRLAGFTLDYAMLRQGDPTERVTNYFSVGFVGQKKKETTVPIVYPTPEPTAVAKIKRVRFADIPPAHFAKDPAEMLATAGLIPLPPDGMFRPDDKMTRMEFSLACVQARNISTTDPCGTIGGPAWAKSPDKTVWRKEAAKFMGLSVRIERPSEALTRGEFAVLLAQSAAGQNALKRLPALED